MKTDVLIIGGGPAGAASALHLLAEGITPVIVEAEAFPRYHIGESMTGVAGQVVRDLGFETEMHGRRYPTKQGVKIFGQSDRGSWFVPVKGRDEEWQLFDWETWQVRRSDFDAMLLDAAVARGATLVRGQAIAPVWGDAGIAGADVRLEDGRVRRIRSQMLLDCSGMATWLANLGGVTGPKYMGAYDRQIAIFSQVAGARRDEGIDKTANRERHRDNTLIYYQRKHHWAWFIPIDADVVSVGVVVPAAYFKDMGETVRDFYLRELRELHPELAGRVEGCPLVEDVRVSPNYSYQVKGFGGRGFLCVGDAHRFIDPIFSFGLTVALREAQYAAPVVRDYLGGRNRDAANPFAGHQLFCEKGIDVLEDVIDAFWEHPLAFAWSVHARHTEQMIDLLAGRLYEHEHQPSDAVNSFRQLLGRTGEREKSYASEDLYSIPIGSRYHPERAAIWHADLPVR